MLVHQLSCIYQNQTRAITKEALFARDTEKALKLGGLELRTVGKICGCKDLAKRGGIGEAKTSTGDHTPMVKFDFHYYKKDFRRQPILLAEAITKFTCLLKYLRIFRSRHFIYVGSHKSPVSQNGSTVVVRNWSSLRIH
jgi:hypothetical protein